MRRKNKSKLIIGSKGDLSLDSLKVALSDYFYGKVPESDRNITLHVIGQKGLDLFNDALRKKAQELLDKKFTV